MRLVENHPLKATASCKYCGKQSQLISQSLRLCRDCIRQKFVMIQPLFKEAHYHSRKIFNLPAQSPQDERGKSCHLCVNECHISEGKMSYYGLRVNERDKLKEVTANRANVIWYCDLYQQIEKTRRFPIPHKIRDFVGTPSLI